MSTDGLTLICLALTAYRVVRLIVRDDFPPILWLRDRLVGGWRPLTTAEYARYQTAGLSDPWRSQLDTAGPITKIYVRRRAWVPWWLAELLGCPWCVSAYVAAVLTAATDVTVGIPVPWLVAPAVWAAAAILASRETL